ncbi:MAG: hypothetical protein Q9197_000351 [Variospora fuerteventurae]
MAQHRRLSDDTQPSGQAYVRLMEPLEFYTIFPYIAQMTKHNGDIPDTDLGFFSGLFGSLFSAVQAGVLIFWVSMAKCVDCRFILLCTPERQSRTIGWYTFADIIAYFAGRLLGSALADPFSQYPAVFNGVSLFEHFPYALPGMVTGAVYMRGAAVTVLFIDDRRKVSKEEPNTASGEREDTQGHHRPSIGKLIKAPALHILLSFRRLRVSERARPHRKRSRWGASPTINMSPDPQVLGTPNAVAESCSSVVKTVTPAASAAVFAIGVRGQVLGDVHHDLASIIDAENQKVAYPTATFSNSTPRETMTEKSCMANAKFMPDMLFLAR